MLLLSLALPRVPLAVCELSYVMPVPGYAGHIRGHRGDGWRSFGTTHWKNAGQASAASDTQPTAHLHPRLRYISLPRFSSRRSLGTSLLPPQAGTIETALVGRLAGLRRKMAVSRCVRTACETMYRARMNCGITPE